MPDTLHLVKVPLRAEKLVAVARRRGLPLREIDEGYLGHVIMRELWQERAPAPFVLRGSGRVMDAWGYSHFDAASLIEHAAAFGDPSLLTAIDDLKTVASRLVPRFEPGRRLGFVVRTCPVVRLAGPKNGHRAGAEVDAFLARCFGAGETSVSREEVYRDWLRRALAIDGSGIAVASIGVIAMSRERLVRRTHGEVRDTSRIERPDVRFKGDLIVTDGERLLTYLARGVGRHRAFGFGALMLAPPGSASPPVDTSDA